MNSDRVFSVLAPLLRRWVERQRTTARHYFDAVPVPPGRVLFLGDSITAGGLWGDLLPDLPTSTRGIGGDTVQDLGARLDGVLDAPVAVNLMIGTNDLHGLRERHDAAEVAARAEDVVRRIRSAAPEALLLLNSVLPRTALFAPRIRALNERYAELAPRHGATYVDLWPVFADPSGAIKPALTRDNLHLTPQGYLAWAAALRPHLAALAERTGRNN